MTVKLSRLPDYYQKAWIDKHYNEYAKLISTSIDNAIYNKNIPSDSILDNIDVEIPAINILYQPSNEFILDNNLAGLYKRILLKKGDK